MKIFFIILGAYALVCLAAYIMQGRLVFFPTDEDAGKPSDVGLDYKDVTFAGPDGRDRHGWMIPVADARYTLLFCHGNAGNITHRLESIRQFVDAGLSVFIFDYGGYGKSRGRPSESGTYGDALAAWDYLVETEGVDPARIILFGRSLGAAVAIDLATRESPRALIVESAFTSAVDIGARAYPWLPVRYLARVRYDNMKKVPHIRAPKLFIHSLEDRTVPFGMGKRLYNRAARPKTFVRLRGTHDDGFIVSADVYMEALRKFLDSLDSEREQRKGRT